MRELHYEYRAGVLVRVFRRLFNDLCAFGDSIHRGLDLRTRFERLDMMSDDELSRLGLKRSDIPAVLSETVLKDVDRPGPQPGGSGHPPGANLHTYGHAGRHT